MYPFLMNQIKTVVSIPSRSAPFHDTPPRSTKGMKGPLILFGLSISCFVSLWALKFVPGVYSEMSPLGFLIFGIGALGILLGLVAIILGIVKLESHAGKNEK